MTDHDRASLYAHMVMRRRLEEIVRIMREREEEIGKVITLEPAGYRRIEINEH